jgi:hypothetical protein
MFYQAIIGSCLCQTLLEHATPDRRFLGVLGLWEAEAEEGGWFR